MVRSSRISSVLRLGFVLSLAAMVPIHVSCAADGALGSSPEQDAESPGEAGIPVIPDAGGDAPDGDGDTPSRSCNDVDWCPVTTGVDPAYTLTSVWGSSSTDVWAVGSGGTALHWGGAEWKAVVTNTTGTLLSVWGSGPNDVWVAGSGAVVLHSPGMPAGTFSPAPPAVSWGGSHVHVVWGTSASDVRLAGAPVALYDEYESYIGTFNQWRRSSVDGGVGWQTVSTGTDLTIRGMWGTANDVWLVGDNSVNVGWMAGTILRARSGDGGTGPFVAVDSQTTSRLEAIWGSAADDVWAVGARGTIRHYTGGLRFAIVASPVTTDLHAVWGSGPKDVWAVGEQGTVIHFDGASWRTSTTNLGPGLKPDLGGIWGSGPNDVWAVGGSAALHFTGPKAGVDGGRK